jgi:hypothetical protein
LVVGLSGSAVGIPRAEARRSCSGVTLMGVIRRALAASVRMPTALW